jgi:hypothetical protein
MSDNSGIVLGQGVEHGLAVTSASRRSVAFKAMEQLKKDHERGLPHASFRSPYTEGIPGAETLRFKESWGVRMVYRIKKNEISIVSIEFDPPPSGGGGACLRPPENPKLDEGEGRAMSDYVQFDGVLGGYSPTSIATIVIRAADLIEVFWGVAAKHGVKDGRKASSPATIVTPRTPSDHQLRRGPASSVAAPAAATVYHLRRQPMGSYLLH